MTCFMGSARSCKVSSTIQNLTFLHFGLLLEAEALGPELRFPVDCGLFEVSCWDGEYLCGGGPPPWLYPRSLLDGARSSCSPLPLL
jgi:hypothetical protein